MLTKSLTQILLLSIAILLLTDILLRFLFWNDLHLIWDADNFNNIVTPIGAIVSTVLFFVALRLTIKQNQIIVSQNEKSNFEHEVKDLKEKLETDISNSVMMTTGMTSKTEIFSGVTSLNYLDKIQETIDRLHRSQQYGIDIKYYENKEMMHTSDLVKSDYYYDVRLLLTFSQFPVVKYYHVTNFIDDIGESQMLEVDKAFIKRKVRTFVERYINFVQHSSDIVLPDIYDQTDNQIQWKKYRDTGFDRYYKTFMTEL